MIGHFPHPQEVCRFRHIRTSAGRILSRNPRDYQLTILIEIETTI
jgi:hypothetical protein